MRTHDGPIVLAIATAATLAAAATGCSSSQKRIAPRDIYRAGFVASNDGHSYFNLLDLMAQAEKARPACRSVNSNMATKAQYLVRRTDDAIKIEVTECESAASGNCDKLKTCLSARPVAWLSRASGRKPDLSGVIETDWVGRCGGLLAVNFYYGPQTHEPVEKVGCAEPAHDAVDTAYDMMLVPRPRFADGTLFTQDGQATAPLIENLLRRWDTLVFHAAPEGLGL